MRKLLIPELDDVFDYWNRLERFYDKDDDKIGRRHTEKWYRDRTRVADMLDKLARIEKYALGCL